MAGGIQRRILDRMNGGEDGFSGPATAFSALWRWKFLETPVARSAINAGFKLRAVPQATASLANFQLHAQIHN
jgi:hypothetical protein